MITLDAYWKGRDKEYANELTEQIQANAAETVKRVNQLLALAEADTGMVFEEVSSGWRPAEVNDATANAASHSKHLTAEACDVRDPQGHLDEWCVQNQDKLAEIGLWLELPKATPTWTHLQTVAPKSHARIFVP